MARTHCGAAMLVGSTEAERRDDGMPKGRRPHFPTNRVLPAGSEQLNRNGPYDWDGNDQIAGGDQQGAAPAIVERRAEGRHPHTRGPCPSSEDASLASRLAQLLPPQRRRYAATISGSTIASHQPASR